MSERLNGNIAKVSDRNQSATPNVLQNEKINEIISNEPGFLIRSGFTMFFLILLGIVAATFFIQYPDTILAKAKLASINPPKEVKVKADGKLAKLNAVQGCFVKQGEILGFLECSANNYEVMKLAESVDTMQMLVSNNQAEAITKYLLQSYRNIGALQKAYIFFMEKLILFNQSLSREYYLKNRIMSQRSNYIIQQKIMVIQALTTLKAELDEWKNKYFIIAPVDGVISYAGFFYENQELQSNQTVCFINPENPKYYAEVYIPQNKLEKVGQRQRVLLSLPTYPSQEYGAVEGKLDFISNIATENGVIAMASLPNGLRTNFNKLIQIKEGLVIEAEIITAEIKLSTRLISQMKKIFKK